MVTKIWNCDNQFLSSDLLLGSDFSSNGIQKHILIKRSVQMLLFRRLIEEIQANVQPDVQPLKVTAIADQSSTKLLLLFLSSWIIEIKQDL
jgi:hypothetical protein